MKLDSKEIMTLIPQRYPFLFVDRVEELAAGERIVAVKNVSMGEPVFTGHFPGEPVLPGVIIVEALAQASGILVAKSFPEFAHWVPYLVGMDNFRFRHPVVPGNSLRLESEIKRHIRNFFSFSCKASVDGEVVAEGEILTVISKEAK